MTGDAVDERPEPEIAVCVGAEGIWRQAGPDARFGLAWDEIEWVQFHSPEMAGGKHAKRVMLYTRDGGIGLELDLTVHDDLQLAALGARLGLPPDWQEGAVRWPRLVWARHAPPQLHADDSGLWCGELDLFTEWGEIDGVIVRKDRDGASMIELRPANGGLSHLRELSEAAPGFEACARAIGARLAGLGADWLTAARQALAAGAAVTVWRRSVADGYPCLTADDLGVCREDGPGQAFDLAWDDIVRVLARRAGEHIEIELEAVTGTHLLLRSGWPGYAELTAAMPAKLPGLTAARLAQADALRPGHAVWRRGWVVAGESVGPDGTLTTAWQRVERPD